MKQSAPPVSYKYFNPQVLSVFLLVIIAVNFSFYLNSKIQLERVNTLRFQSLLLTKQLLLTSDTMTRMARTYLATGDSIHKQHYQQALAIWNGKKTRDSNFDEIYHDLARISNGRLSDGDKVVNLFALISRTAVTQTELAKLTQAKLQSDQLIDIEMTTMSQIDTAQPVTEDDRNRVFEQLFTPHYLQALTDFHTSIKTFNKLLNQRNLQTILTAENQAMLALISLILLSFLLIINQWLMYRQMYNTLGCSLSELNTYFPQLELSDSLSLALKPDKQKSLRFCLSEALTNLHRMEIEQKQLQSELLDSQNLFQLLAEVNPVGIYRTNAEGKCIYLTERGSQITGLSLEQAMNEGWHSVIMPEDLEKVAGEWQASVDEKRPFELEYRFQLANDSITWVYGQSVAIVNDKEEVTGYVGTITDITQLKTVEAAFRESEYGLNEAQRIAHIGSWHINFADHEITWSEELYKILGLDPALSPPPYGEYKKLLTPASWQQFSVALNETRTRGIPYELELETVRKGFSNRWIWVRGEQIRDANGQPVGIRGVALDITQRKEEQIEQHIAATVFEAQEGMMITNVDEKIIKVNQAFTDITGYSATDVIGLTPRLLKSGRHDISFYHVVWKTINETGTWQGEIWNKRKNGEIFPEWLTITAVKDNNSITHYVGTFVDITERKATEDYINKLAFYDHLTNLPNRRLLLERIKHAINVSDRNGTEMAVLMLDLDKFKAVNDNLGHSVGDELLMLVTKRINLTLRQVDTLARHGGDEFVILIEDLKHIEDVTRVAEAIIQTLGQPFTLGQMNEVYIGASIGISLYPHHGHNVEELMNSADTALYHAKDSGRGCHAYFSAELSAKIRARIALETRLRRAIEKQELSVYFQPKISLKSGKMVAAEALVRWQDSDNICISPTKFIPLAEESGMIMEIGEWVLRETCQLGRQWLDQGLPALILAVNVSPYQFRCGDIKELVRQVLRDTGFPASHLELEITESGVMENQEQALSILNDIHAQGVHLAMDDFGTGYSSLAFLKYFPLDVLKIDKNFIDEIPAMEGDMAITETIISMAHHLGFKVLAEGVETPEQLAFLQSHGCDFCQGFLFSEALKPSAFEVLLNSSSLDDNP